MSGGHATQLEGRMNRKGFTLIELLIVVVIIGILAAIAIPKFANTKEKAIVASMKSDLRNLVTAQEAFYSDNQDYAGGTYVGDGTVYTQTAGLGGAGRLAITPSSNNTVVVAYKDAAGWAATSTNPSVKAVASDVCGVYVGSGVNPNAAAIKAEGAPACY
jgi:type IV pilus assembly protein PilA